VLAACLADLDRALAGERWCVIGAQAAICHGSDRATLDVDLSVLAGPERAEALIERLALHGIGPRIADAVAFAMESRVLLMRHVASGFPIDLVLAGPGLEAEFIARAERISLFGRDVPVIDVSDLVASKLFAGRERDLEDVRALLRGAKVEPVRVREVLGLLEDVLDRSDLVVAFDRELHRCERR